MATLSYTLYNYAQVPADLIAVDPTAATSDAVFSLSPNGPFPNSWWLNEEGQWEGGYLDGSLRVSIDGYDIGGVFLGPPGMDTSGYFAPDDGGHSGITATIPRDIWRAIIADGELRVEYRLGLDAESLARADDYITFNVNWLESYNGVRGSPAGDDIVVNMPTIIEGRGGDDTIAGSGQGDIIMGGADNDLISGGGGQDTIRGGDGDDHIDAGDGDDVVLGGTGADDIAGGTGADRLRGNEGNDVITGGDGNDVLWGGDGDDALTGGQGNNHLFGGAGADEFRFSAAIGAETQHVYDFDRSAGDRLIYVQDFDEVVDAYDIRDGKDGTVVTIGGLSIILSGVNDLTQSDIEFQSDPDWPFLSASAATPPLEVIRGTEGYDELRSDVPAIMFGLGDGDWITGSEGGDVIMGGAGNDDINGRGGDNVIRGGDGADIIGTEEGNDYLSGGPGNDELWSGGGDDTLVGGTGHDQLYAGAGNDTLRGQDGTDNLIGGEGDDLLSGGNDRDYLYGQEGSDRLRGEAGDDDLSGWDDTDYLWGGDGADRLWGGLGTNHLWGGAGADQFMFFFEDTEGTQYIHDFDRSAGDTIVYGPAWDQVVDDIDIRVGKNGSVVSIGDTTIVLSGVFDLTPADITVISDGYWPWEV